MSSAALLDHFFIWVPVQHSDSSISRVVPLLPGMVMPSTGRLLDHHEVFFCGLKFIHWYWKGKDESLRFPWCGFSQSCGPLCLRDRYCLILVSVVGKAAASNRNFINPAIHVPERFHVTILDACGDLPRSRGPWRRAAHPAVHISPKEIPAVNATASRRYHLPSSTDSSDTKSALGRQGTCVPIQVVSHVH